MFIVTLISTLISAQGAIAQPSADPTRSLQNLVYYPHAGQFAATPGYLMDLNATSDVQNDVGSETSSSTTHLYEITGVLDYGIIDRLRVSLDENYVMDSSSHQTNTNTGVVTTSHSRGFSDPHLVFAYRYLENQTSNVYADVALNIGTNWGPAVAAYSPQDRTGNELAGNWNPRSADRI